MIVKRIQRRGGGGFKRLAAYVTNEPGKGRGDPTRWKLAEYIFDAQHEGRKVGSIRITNCASLDPGWAVKECVALAERNTRSKRDKAYHLVVSFREGERPTPAQLVDIEDEVVKAIGLQDHKRISATHTNTDNLHIHIAICTVHPKTLRNVEPYYDHLRLQGICQALELRHGLQVDNFKVQADKVAFAAWMQGHAGEIAEAARQARNWQELHAALTKHGLVIKPRGAGLVIAHHADGKIRIKASEVTRDMSYKALTDRLGAYRAPEADRTMTAEREFTPGPEPTPAEQSLWDRYRAYQVATAAARDTAMARLRAQQSDYGRRLAAWYAERTEGAWTRDLIRADRLMTLRAIAAEKKADRAERITREKAERDAVKLRHRTMGWSEFLTVEAARGDRPATQEINRMILREAEVAHAPAGLTVIRKERAPQQEAGLGLGDRSLVQGQT